MDLADVVRRHGPAYLQRHGARLLPSHRAALEDILRCHTPAAGGSLYRCGACGAERFAYHRCGNRACGQCGHAQAQAWLERQQEQLLAGVPYFLVTFTVPEALRAIFRQHQRLLYGMLLRESAATLQDIAAKPKHFGGSLALLGVLHTWTRQLVYHPHVHYVIPGVALAPDGTLAFGASPDFFLPVQVLSARFRTRLKDALRAEDPQLLATIPAKVWRAAWVVHSQPAGSGEKTLEYLSRYVFKTAISSARLLWQDDERVAFSYRDSATREERTCVLPGEEPELPAGAEIDREAARRARSPRGGDPVNSCSASFSMSCRKASGECAPMAGFRRPQRSARARCMRCWERIHRLPPRIAAAPGLHQRASIGPC